jgi:S-disulfanyl-L-cysteine oxidoreductase SoxD
MEKHPDPGRLMRARAALSAALLAVAISWSSPSRAGTGTRPYKVPVGADWHVAPHGTDPRVGPRKTSKSQWDGIYTDAQASRGEALYVDNCVRCHGTDLGGTILAPAVAGPVFLEKWNRRPLSLVFTVIQTRMPWNLSGHLSPQQNADVLAYMLKKSGSPAGRDELPPRAEVLSALTILDRRR